ncbi:hypothetical protein C1J00_21215, partial [Streptomyces cahuitamycinicus]
MGRTCTGCAPSAFSRQGVTRPSGSCRAPCPPRRPPRVRRLAHAAAAGRALGDARQSASVRRYPGRSRPGL